MTPETQDPTSEVMIMNSDLEFDGFRTWIRTSKRLSGSTANVYATALRAFFVDRATAKELSADRELLKVRALAHDLSLEKGRKHTFRSALRAFIEYANAGANTQLEVKFPDERKTRWKKRRAIEDAIRTPLVPHLRELEKRGVPLDRLPFIRWRDVVGGVSGGAGILQDKSAERNYPAPLTTIQAIGLWAGGAMRPKPSQPFVPTAPGGKTPLPFDKIERLLRGE